jgi:hypothetical protein
MDDAMTPAQLRAEIEQIPLTQAAIAEEFGLAPATFRRYLMEPGTPSALTVPRWMPYAIAGLRASLGRKKRAAGA